MAQDIGLQRLMFAMVGKRYAYLEATLNLKGMGLYFSTVRGGKGDSVEFMIYRSTTYIECYRQKVHTMEQIHTGNIFKWINKNL